MHSHRLGVVAGGSPHWKGDIVTSDTRTGRFAAHVHEVVDLDAHGASLETIEARVDSMVADREEQSALSLLASSLRNGAHTHRGAPNEPRLTDSHR